MGELLVADLVVAELVYVLESVYQQGRTAVANAVRAVVTFAAIRVSDSELLLRSAEVYESGRLDYAEAYLVACAERSGVAVGASLDHAIRRVPSVTPIEP